MIDTGRGWRYRRLPEAPLDRANNIRFDSWPVILGILAVQVVLLAIWVVDWRVPVVLAGGFVAATVMLDRPVWTVGVMLAARLVATTTTSFFSIGSISIGLFEPVLALAALALGLRAVFTQRPLWFSWPWKTVYLVHLGWMVVGLFGWSLKLSDGLKDILPLVIIFSTSTVIIAFVESWTDVKLMLWIWIATCVGIGVLTFAGPYIGMTDYSSQWKAASGGRSTGLGQQPNWFSMNLMFVVHSTAAFALVQKRASLRWGLLVACLFIFFTQMTSGSRGGAYSIVIGGMLVSLGQPMFRKWFFGLSAGALGIVFVAVTTGLFDLGSGWNRIINNIDVLFAEDIRGMNWYACWEMFRDSFGRGIGPGGYIDYLAKYSWFIFESVYRYPHGIFWGEMAHGGVPGIMLLIAMVLVITRMTWQTIQDTKGTEAEVLAWSMPASMAGYFAWSFVEFNYDEKPFWEWLALYTALHLVAKRAKEGKTAPIPEWTLTFA